MYFQSPIHDIPKRWQWDASKTGGTGMHPKQVEPVWQDGWILKEGLEKQMLVKLRFVRRLEYIQNETGRHVLNTEQIGLSLNLEVKIKNSIMQDLWIKIVDTDTTAYEWTTELAQEYLSNVQSSNECAEILNENFQNYLL